MLDHGYPTKNGNTGAGLKLGLLDDPGEWHYSLMLQRLNEVCPGVQIIQGKPGPASEVYRLAGLGCAVIAMPWIMPSISSPGQDVDLDAALTWADQKGVLLFAGVGDNNPVTGYPANHGSVFSCGAINGDGSPNHLGNTLSGPCAIGITCGSASEATALAAGMAILWLGYGVHTHGDPSQRHNGWWHWLTDTGVQTLRGIAPMCARL